MVENRMKAEGDEQKPAGKSLFSSVEQRLRLEKYFEDGFPVRHLPRVLFVFILGLVYIGNTHYAERTT
ncbi:MAG: FtsL-like putative cell division protein, partial [Bacteroidota bacterium]